MISMIIGLITYTLQTNYVIKFIISN